MSTYKAANTFSEMGVVASKFCYQYGGPKKISY